MINNGPSGTQTRAVLSARGGRMEPAVSRGYGPLKITSWPQAAVVVAGLIAIAVITIALVSAGWDAETIIALAAAAAAIVTGQYVQTRRASELDAKQDQQTRKIDTVVRQTNGEFKATVSAAVQEGIAAATAAYRAEQEANRRG